MRMLSAVYGLIKHHLLEAHDYELLRRMGLKRHFRGLLDFSLCPVAIAARVQQHTYLPNQDLRLLCCLFPGPTSDEHQESCYQSTTKHTSQHCTFLHGAEIAHCRFTQLLTATLHPILEVRKAAEICLWHWETRLLILLRNVGTFMPNFWQLDVLSGLTEASFRTRPPSDMIISPFRIFFHVPNPAKTGDHSWGDTSPPKARLRGCSTMEREQ